jgi:hypothetical protein
MGGAVRPGRVVLAVLAGTLLFGAWPAIRNLAAFGRPHVDNFEYFGALTANQLPGELERVDFRSFRLFGLLRHPWAHASNLDSFWTMLYANYWFDVQGTQNTLKLSPEWREHAARVMAERPQPSRERSLALRKYDSAVTPQSFRGIARAAYLVGLPVAVAMWGGLALAARRALADPAHCLLLGHGVLCLLLPLVQTVRQPVLGAMKAEFTLSGLSSFGLFAALAFRASSNRGRWVAGGISAALALALLAVNVAYAVVEHHLAQGTTFQAWAMPGLDS